MKQTRSLSKFSCLSEYSQLYPRQDALTNNVFVCFLPLSLSVCVCVCVCVSQNKLSGHYQPDNGPLWLKLYLICIIYDKYTKQHRIRLKYNHYTKGIQKKVKYLI